MATSLEKAQGMVDQLLDLPDKELRAMLPRGLPVAMVRGLMPFMANLLPATVEEFDHQLDHFGKFLAALRSDESA